MSDIRLLFQALLVHDYRVTLSEGVSQIVSQIIDIRLLIGIENGITHKI